MSNTGIVIDDSVMEAFIDVKKRGSLNRYSIFKIGPKYDKVEVVKTVTKDDSGTWADFCDEFDDKECSYACYVVPIKNSEGTKDDKLVLFACNGPSAKVKAKMLHAGTWNTLKAKLNADHYVETDGRQGMLDIEEICKTKLKNSTFDGVFDRD